jgi:hypothetical protein
MVIFDGPLQSRHFRWIGYPRCLPLLTTHGKTAGETVFPQMYHREPTHYLYNNIALSMLYAEICSKVRRHIVRDSSAVRRLFVRLAGAVGRQSALRKENSGYSVFYIQKM